MSWLPTLAAWPFAAAGLTAAAATLLIHLLNRRRPRTIAWGAMDFLREALRKNRRTIRWRDAILIALRCLAVLLFGLALARPHFAGQDDSAALQPVHLIVTIDNSLSMAFETLNGTVLGKSQRAAARLLDDLPPGSLVSVIPSAGSARPSPPIPYPQREEAVAAIRQIRVADQPTDLGSTLARIGQAADLSADLPKRIVFFTDLQDTTWREPVAAEPSGSEFTWQLVDISPGERDNTSVAGISVAGISVTGGFAVADEPAAISAMIRRSSGRSARDVEVRLLVDDVAVGSRTLELPAGDSERAVHFAHAFSSHGNPAARPRDSIVSVSITPDRLPQDDIRHAIVPVFNRWPVVFVDQFGGEAEEPARGKLGETWAVRRLLTAKGSGFAKADPIHVSPVQLSDEHLAAARAVVVAGVRDPQQIAGRLRAFVERGGQLLLAAGGDFDPAAWNAAAWLGGRGVLPLELDDSLLGQAPDETEGDLQPWLLDTDSLVGQSLFRLPEASAAELLDLYREPLFFKQLQINEPPADDDSTRILAWLRFAGDADVASGASRRIPLLVERRSGAGRTLLLTTGLRPQWNTLAKTNAVVIFDRLLRDLVRDTLPLQDFAAGERLQVPLPADVRRDSVSVVLPNQTAFELTANDDAGEQAAAVAAFSAVDRGVYRLTAGRKDSSEVWDFPVAVNGAAVESDLTKAGDDAMARFAAGRNVALTISGDSVSEDSVSIHGLFQPRAGLAWWLVALVFALLVVESAILTASAMFRSAMRGDPNHRSWIRKNFAVTASETELLRVQLRELGSTE